MSHGRRQKFARTFRRSNDSRESPWFTLRIARPSKLGTKTTHEERFEKPWQRDRERERERERGWSPGVWLLPGRSGELLGGSAQKDQKDIIARACTLWHKIIAYGEWFWTIFEKLTSLRRNSLKMTFFPGHFESTKCLKDYEKLFSGNSLRNTFVPEAIFQGSVNGGFQTMVRVWSGDRIPLPPCNLNFASFLPQFYLIWTSFLPLFHVNLTSASSGISNHGLETTYPWIATQRSCYSGPKTKNSQK